EKVIFNDSTMRYTYTNPVMLSGENNRIYLFGRKVAPKSRSIKQPYSSASQYYTFSDDLGESWKKNRILLRNRRKNSRIYMKVCSDNTSRIDFLFTDGHPKENPDISVFHMYYQKGIFYQTDGKKIVGVEELPITLPE